MKKKVFKKLLRAQKSELAAHLIYSHLARKTNVAYNKRILNVISKDELRHHDFFESITKEKVKANKILVWWYVLLSRAFGFSFILKLMERREVITERFYSKLSAKFPVISKIRKDEKKHEKILGRLEEKKLIYASATVLGLNDALVELSGALAGLTLALRNTRLVALTGLIMGLAASLSMTASAYLSAKEEADEHKDKNPFTSAAYTGIAYIFTVFFLVVPYFIFSNIFVALGIMFGVVILIILSYTFYISTAKSLKFWNRFLEMVLISLSVALISFLVGWLLRSFIGVDV